MSLSLSFLPRSLQRCGPRAELFLVDGLVERAHRNRVARLLPRRDRGDRRADALQEVVIRVELAQLVLEGVVRGVADERRAVVVSVLVLPE